MTLVNSRTVRGRCPCGAPHAACGPPSTTTPVLENLEVAVVGGPLKLYDVVMHGVATRMKLNEADARRYGGTPVDATPDPPEEQPPAAAEVDEVPSKSRTPANKSRTARGKAASGDG